MESTVTIRNKLKLDNYIPHLIGTFPIRKLYQENGIDTEFGKFVLNELRLKGHGDLVEKLTKKYFVCEEFTNIQYSKPNDFYDFSFVDVENTYIDIRRIGTRGINLHYTNASKKKSCLWQDKADKLNLGGYVAVHINENEFIYYYLPAKRLLNDIGHECSEYLKIETINIKYGLDIPLPKNSTVEKNYLVEDARADVVLIDRYKKLKYII